MIGHYSIGNMIAFGVLVVIALVIDLLAHRQDKPISMKSAALWSVFWIALALAFCAYIYETHSSGDAFLFLTGYLLEKSLSVDNLFVMMAIFANFGIPGKFQHRVLYYGILGALVFRMIFVAAGASLLAVFGHWALLGFGLFVLWSAWKMAQAVSKGESEISDYSDHWSVRTARKLMPVHDRLEGHNFFTRENGKLMATPLLLCLFSIELADVMFAFDSVPAIFAITPEPFLVYTSNIFAILGLRSLYFLLAAAKNALCHLDKAVVAILTFIGLKMLIDVAGIYHMPPALNLGVVLGLLLCGVVASFIWPKKVSAEPAVGNAGNGEVENEAGKGAE